MGTNFAASLCLQELTVFTILYKKQQMESLAEFSYSQEHLRDWSATGCVEPTISGKHMGHTNCMMFNMVAAL